MKRLIALILAAALVLPLASQSRNRRTGSTQTTTKTAATKTKPSATNTKTNTKTKTKTNTNTKTKTKTQLRSEQAATQKARKQSQEQLARLNRNVKANLDSVLILDNQIGRQQTSIDSLNKDIASLNADIDTLSRQLTKLQKELAVKKQRYAKTMVHIRKHRSVQNKLMFIFSAENFTQMMRRMRYMKEYSTFQKAQGELLKDKQQEVRAKQNELLAAKAKKEQNLNDVRHKQQALVGMKASCQSKVEYLNRNIATVQKQINDYQKREQALNAEIDRIIQQEIEAARRAEEERRRKEEARKKAEAEAARKSMAAKTNAKASSKSTTNNNARTPSKAPATTTWKSNESSADAKLSSNFSGNKGRLPIPITGSYSIVGHYGRYSVTGLKNVTLDNKGIDIRGQQGCCARSVFDGKVSSVFQYGGAYIVMVRHGSYISVYSGLSSVSVRMGQNVKTRDTLGAVGQDQDGRYILHFQLRNETSRLNPEQWIR